jgi:hypothetical protein
MSSLVGRNTATSTPAPSYYRARYYDPTTARFVKEDGSELELELVRERINEYSERLFISALLFASSCANPAPRPACFG